MITTGRWMPALVGSLTRCSSPAGQRPPIRPPLGSTADCTAKADLGNSWCGSKPEHLAGPSARSRREAAVGAAVLSKDHHQAVRIGGKRHHVCWGVGSVLGPAVEQAAPPDL